MANEDLKAKMREALERKKAHDGVDEQADHSSKGKPHDTHGPQGGPQMHRRKAGGGGS